MKFSNRTKEDASRVFSLFMWFKYLDEIGEPVIDDLEKIRVRLVDKYKKEITPLTRKIIDDVIRTTGVIIMSDKESYSRVASGILTVGSVYFNEHNLDKLNLQEYIVQNMVLHNHVDKIPLVLSELDKMEFLIKDSVRKYENGIKYGDKPVKRELKISEAKQIIINRNNKTYKDMVKDLK